MTEEQLLEAVHEYATSNGYARTPKQKYPVEARAKLLEAIESWASGLTLHDVRVRRAKVGVCDAWLKSMYTASFSEKEDCDRMRDAFNRLRELQAKEGSRL